MRYASAFVLAVAGLAAAQSSSSAAAGASSSSSATSGGSSGCGDQVDQIITSCLASTQPQVKACKANDWTCLCDSSQQVDTCFNNCPSDPRAFGQQQTTTSYCNAAKAYSSSSTSGGSTMSATGGSGAGGATGTMATATSTSGGSGNQQVQTGYAQASGSDAAGASASASQSGNSASGFAPAGGLIAAIFGLALI